MKGKKGTKGRPKFIFTDKMVEEIYRLAKIGTPDDDIARYMGCGEATLQNNNHEPNPVFYALLNGRLEGKGKVRQTLWNMAVSGKCPAATIFYGKTRLGMSERVEVVGKDGGPVEHRHTHEMTDDMLEKIASAKKINLGGEDEKENE